MPSITINPIDGTDVITDNAINQLWLGTLTGYTTPQDLFLSFSKAYGAPDATLWHSSPQGPGQWNFPVQLLGNPPDGVYTATVGVGIYPPAPVEASETFILATHSTPFEAVGMAFMDAETNLAAPTVSKAALYADFTAEVAGLGILHQYDAFPTKAFNALVKDITKEISTLDYLPALPAAVATGGKVSKLTTEQSGIAAYVAHQPALVALMPDHIGWSV